MGCFPFANFDFQLGVTALGFVEDFVHCLNNLEIGKFLSVCFSDLTSKVQQFSRGQGD